MVINYRIDEEIVILSNLGGLLNDPRHFDALRDVKDLLAQEYRKFIMEMRGVRELSPTALGLLTTLTRAIRQGGGDIVLCNVSQVTERLLDEMRMDLFWEMFDSVDDALGYFDRGEK
jgi:anti-anti-sigma factor